MVNKIIPALPHRMPSAEASIRSFLQNETFLKRGNVLEQTNASFESAAQTFTVNPSSSRGQADNGIFSVLLR